MLATLTQFKNEALTDFSDPRSEQAFRDALEKVKAEFGREYPLVIGGETLNTDGKFRSYNPSNMEEVVGVFQKSTAEMAARTIEVAHDAFRKWRRTPAEKRSEIILKAAEIMKARKHELSATMVYEEGKSWVEADADTAEAIDFLEFYARENLRYAGPQPITPYPGEKPELVYIPLGTVVVISPWNFPLAILCGMTSAALVAGNSVVLKPASDSPLIAYKCVEILLEAGIPDGVLNFLTGLGAELGSVLVEHPKTRMIAFTGSKEVGLKITELAARCSPGQIWVKRVIAEMGGKDSIVIDDEADLDAAADGIVAAAFGFQGQKCSACSRAIISESVYDSVLEKVIERTKKIRVGPVDKRENTMGPVINKSSLEKILKYVEIGKNEGRLVTGGEWSNPAGYFIDPTIFADVKSHSRLAQEEIFGPLLAVIKAKDYDDALHIANDSEYGLTGSVYTGNRDKIEKAKKEFHVGNLYINRKCTGALVGVHPFGGFNMSGTDSKAGGRDYLLLFLQAKAISEKT